MKQVHLYGRIFQLLITGSVLATFVPPLMADPSVECRAEAKEYAIPPEQSEDYVRDCILSRGGELAPAAGVEDMPVPGTDDEEIPPPQAEDMTESDMPADPLQ
jgi:hypothetical protein